jgi:hypothetical protein
MWEIFSFGKEPYEGISNPEVVDRITQGYRMEAPNGCPDQVYQIMKR